MPLSTEVKTSGAIECGRLSIDHGDDLSLEESGDQRRLVLANALLERRKADARSAERAKKSAVRVLAHPPSVSELAARHAMVFDRAEAMGLRFVGPQSPNGRQANPWPAELPEGSRNVPTYHTRQQGPMRATRQLDFVFASQALADRLSVRALNADPDEWGPSDHCRVAIELKS